MATESWLNCHPYLPAISGKNVRAEGNYKIGISCETTVELDEGKTRMTVSNHDQGVKLPDKIGELARDGQLGGLEGKREQLLSGRPD